MVNMGRTRYMNYEIKLNVKIFADQKALLRFQEALEHEYDLLNLIDSKDYERAHVEFEKHMYEFKKAILDPDLIDYDLKLPSYLRSFTSGSVYCKILSIYANEILQRLRKYNEANQLFEFLLFKQNVYLLTHRARWFERLALNYESHLKEPLKAFEVLSQGLKDHEYVKRAGRLALYQRLLKMSETKRYMKIRELKERLKSSLIVDKFDFQQAPTVEIEAVTFDSELIPGRKTIFMHEPEQFESETNLAVDEALITEHSSDSATTSSSLMSRINRKGTVSSSVENVALAHYVRTLNFTNGKHGETSNLTTIFGILFWDIIFDNSVYNVFVDRFQSAPLDLQTEHFYSNRKEQIDSRLELLDNSPIEFVCELISECWTKYCGVECSIVNWALFDSLDELLSLIRCFSSHQLTSLCAFMCKNYRYCRSGGPDLLVWSTRTNKCKFVEVKGPGDRLSYKQMMWLDFLIKNAIDCEVCYVKSQNCKRLRTSFD
jgi:Fanconi-associated nuclease 1